MYIDVVVSYFLIDYANKSMYKISPCLLLYFLIYTYSSLKDLHFNSSQTRFKQQF